jgi:hypothetical protein
VVPNPNKTTWVHGIVSINNGGNGLIEIKASKDELIGTKKGSLVAVKSPTMYPWLYRAFLIVRVESAKTIGDTTVCEGKGFWLSFLGVVSLPIVEPYGKMSHLKDIPEYKNVLNYTNTPVYIGKVKGELKEAFLIGFKEATRPPLVNGTRPCLEQYKEASIDGLNVTYGDVGEAGWILGDIHYGDGIKISFGVRRNKHKDTQSQSRITEVHAAIVNEYGDITRDIVHYRDGLWIAEGELRAKQTKKILTEIFG